MYYVISLRASLYRLPLLTAALFFYSLSCQAQNQKSISWMTELPSAHLYQILSDSSMQVSLQTSKVSLRMGITDLDSSRVVLLKLLDSLQVPVTAWLLTPSTEGPQLNWRQGSVAQKRYEEFLKWTHDHQIKWAGIGLYIKPDATEAEWLDKKRSKYAGQLISRMFISDELETSSRNYQNLIHQMQADGYVVELYVPAYQIDAKQVNSTATHWLTGVPSLEADKHIPIFQTSNEHAIATIATYSSEESIAAIGLTLPKNSQIAISWNKLQALIQEAAAGTDEIMLYIPSLSQTSEIIPNLASIEWQGTSTLSEGELVMAKQQRQQMQRLFDLLRYPKLILAGLAIFGLLAIVATIRILARVLS